jgi:hypothetical protein
MAATDRGHRRCWEQYVEFDDEYVFLCFSAQVHIFSRKTRQRVASFPPLANSHNAIGVSFQFIEFEPIPRSDRDPPLSKPDFQRTPMGEWIGRVVSRGSSEAATRTTFPEITQLLGWPLDFTA